MEGRLGTVGGRGLEFLLVQQGQVSWLQLTLSLGRHGLVVGFVCFCFQY